MPDLSRARWAFAVLQVLGGLAVLGSYAWGLQQSDPMRLWGTIPPDWIPPYTACMPFAAVGYLVATGLAWRGSDAATLWRLAVPYAGLLVASAAWMPMSLVAVEQADPGWWTWIQLDLAVTAIASVTLWAHFWFRARWDGGRWWAALVGWTLLCWQTVVLDAVVWPRFFVIGG